MKKRILFVDDSRQVLDSLARMLRTKQTDWNTTFIDDPCVAWEMLCGAAYDTVVLDVNMPRMSGLQLLERIKNRQSTADIPVVMLTGMGDRALKRRALEMGAADLLSKPIEYEELVARIQNGLRLKAYADQLRNQNSQLEKMVQERTAELHYSRLEAIWRLGKAAEHRDTETGNHVIRVGCMSRAVAVALGLDRDFVETVFVASPLHDIGKIAIPDAILMKRGPLSASERQVMMQHCRIGERILREDAPPEMLDEHFIGMSSPDGVKRGQNPWIDVAARIALTHHEKWDGSGYPQGLSGERIPIEARITAIVDVFDALMSERPYKPAFSEGKSLAIIGEEVGSHFDPAIHAAFLKALPELREIRGQLSDSRVDELHAAHRAGSDLPADPRTDPLLFSV